MTNPLEVIAAAARVAWRAIVDTIETTLDAAAILAQVVALVAAFYAWLAIMLAAENVLVALGRRPWWWDPPGAPPG